MELLVKSVLKRILPAAAVDRFRSRSEWDFLMQLEKVRTRRMFAAAAPSPQYLDFRALEALQQKYSFPPEYGYDPNAFLQRGMERAQEILLLPGAKEAKSFLEIGAFDGMVGYSLSCQGKQATAVDKTSAGFDKRAATQGVRFLEMDVTDLQFGDASFDFIYSYNAFEHFASPESVLREAIRVVRTAGLIYLNFGPLYYSPNGEHAYRSITVPYCQFLFPKNMINEFAFQRGLTPIDFSHVNGWSLEQYRDLWDRYSGVLKKTKYMEIADLSHLDLIRAYPSCFKSKSSYFDNFIVGSIAVVFQKTE